MGNKKTPRIFKHKLQADKHFSHFSFFKAINKEERSGGTVDGAQKLQITNLVWLFCLQAGCWIP